MRWHRGGVVVRLMPGGLGLGKRRPEQSRWRAHKYMRLSLVVAGGFLLLMIRCSTHTIDASNSSNAPLVTAIMGVYNAEAHLRCSLESLLGQTYRNLEIVVIDDGSTDSSRKIVDSYHDDRVDIIGRAENIGLTRSLNQGLAVARGQYVARHDADDVSVSTRIAEQVAYFRANPDVDVLGSGIEMFDGRRTLGQVVYDDRDGTFREQLLDFINPFPHSTLMFRRRVLAKLGGYNEHFLRAQDYDFLLRASETFKMASLPKPLVKLRFAPDSLTHADTRQLEFGLAALVCAHRRLLGRSDYSQGPIEGWNRFLQQIGTFVHSNGWARRFRARTHIRQARFAAHAFQIGDCLAGLFRALANDAACLTRRGIGITVPGDIETFLKDDAAAQLHEACL